MENGDVVLCFFDVRESKVLRCIHLEACVQEGKGKLLNGSPTVQYSTTRSLYQTVFLGQKGVYVRSPSLVPAMRFLLCTRRNTVYSFFESGGMDHFVTQSLVMPVVGWITFGVRTIIEERRLYLLRVLDRDLQDSRS